MSSLFGCASSSRKRNSSPPFQRDSGDQAPLQQPPSSGKGSKKGKDRKSKEQRHTAEHSSGDSTNPFAEHRHSTSDNSNNDENSNFWEIGKYKVVVERCDNGCKLTEQLRDCIADRAKIEEDYAKALNKWHRDYLIRLNSDNVEYGGTKSSWKAFLETGPKVADLHTHLAKSLTTGNNAAVAKIDHWLKEKYQKSILNYKQSKQFEAEFEQAQKHWKELVKKAKDLREAYYTAIKKSREADEQVRQAESGAANKYSDEQRAKIRQKANVQQEKLEQAKRAYAAIFQDMESAKPLYQQKMSEVFDKTQTFEHERMQFFRQMFETCHDRLKDSYTAQEDYEPIFSAMLDSVQSVNIQDDLRKWSQQHGPDTPFAMPQYEEYRD